MSLTYIHFSWWYYLIMGYVKEGMLSIQEDRDNKTHILLSSTYHSRTCHCQVQNKAPQVPPNSCSTIWKTRKLKISSLLCFKKLLSFTWKEIQRSLQDRKEWVDSLKILDQACNKSFGTFFSVGSKKRVRYYTFACILYKRHFTSSLISSVVKGFCPPCHASRRLLCRRDDVTSRNPPQTLPAESS